MWHYTLFTSSSIVLHFVPTGKIFSTTFLPFNTLNILYASYVASNQLWLSISLTLFALPVLYYLKSSFSPILHDVADADHFQHRHGIDRNLSLIHHISYATHSCIQPFLPRHILVSWFLASSASFYGQPIEYYLLTSYQSGASHIVKSSLDHA